MSWTFKQNATKADIVHELTRDQENPARRWRTLERTTRGNVLWAVIEVTDKEKGTTENFILCALMKAERGYGWGYKDMTESMGPYYYTCPLAYLDRAPVASAEWRDKVRAYHAEETARRARLRSIKVGETLELVGATIPRVTVTSVKPLRGEYGGRRYRVTPRFIAA